eukprot:g339.t1
MPTFSLAVLASSVGALRLLDRPAMRLYGIISPQSGWGTDLGTTWTDADVGAASQLEFVYPKFSNATAAKLRNRAPRIKYKNFGGTAPQEAPEAERLHHGSLAYYRPGLLAAGISPAATQLRVFRAPHTPHTPQLPWNATCPGGIKASTAPGDATVIDAQGRVTGGYITWLRIGAEFLKITAVEPVPVPRARARAGPRAGDVQALVTVERGLWGSPPAAHGANASVLAPIYHASGSYPDGDAGHIRYALDPGAPWTADYIAAAYDPGQYDGLWMDCFGDAPFRPSDAWGENMRSYMFNVSGNGRYGKPGYVAAQAALTARVRALTAARGATRLYANNVDLLDNAPVLLAPGRLLDGGALEGFSGGTAGPCGFDGTFGVVDEAAWRQHVAQVMNVSQLGLPVMPMIGSAGCESPALARLPANQRESVEDLSYASFLLAAGTRTALYGIVPYRLRDAAAGAAAGVEMALHRRYFLPVGSPAQTVRSAAVDGYRAEGTACTFSRRFSSALVLVNPSANCTDARVPLNGTWYDPGTGEALTMVAMPPQHGKVLLSEPLTD